LLLKQCWSVKPRNRPSFQHILMHLDILRAELDGVTDDQWKYMRIKWKSEVGLYMATIKTDGDAKEDGRYSQIG
jgi:mitogen-activated protein kinase kinase kinase 13